MVLGNRRVSQSEHEHNCIGKSKRSTSHDSHLPGNPRLNSRRVPQLDRRPISVRVASTPICASEAHEFVELAYTTDMRKVVIVGMDYANFTDSDRNAVVRVFPRTANFKEDILKVFYEASDISPRLPLGT